MVNLPVQAYLLLIFLCPSESTLPYTVSLRLTRLLQLTQNLATLQKVSAEMVAIFFKAKMKYYKIVLSGLGLLVMGLALFARYVGQGPLPAGEKVSTAFGYAINFVFGIGFGFGAGSLGDGLGVFGMNVVAIGFVIFFHILTVFMIVTYFVVTNNNKSNQEDDLVLS